LPPEEPRKVLAEKPEMKTTRKTYFNPTTAEKTYNSQQPATPRPGEKNKRTENCKPKMGKKATQKKRGRKTKNRGTSTKYWQAPHFVLHKTG